MWLFLVNLNGAFAAVAIAFVGVVLVRIAVAWGNRSAAVRARRILEEANERWGREGQG